MYYRMFLLVLVWPLASAGDLDFVGLHGGRMTTDDEIAVYQKWVASDPANLNSQKLLAAAYVQKTRETYDFGYLNRAQALIDRVLAARPNDYEAQRIRNLVELNLHHFANVAAYSRAMTRVAPHDPQNWGTLGDALMEMGDYAGAKKAYGTMNTLRPDLFSYNRLAYYRFVTGDVPAAIALMEKAAASESAYPENKAWCQTELGNLFFRTGRIDEAEHAYRSAIATFPNLHLAHGGLGYALAARGEIEAAIQSFKKAQALVPMPQYAGALHDLFEAAGREGEAARQLAFVDLTFTMEQAARQKANRTLALVYANEDRNPDRALELAKADLDVRHDVYTWDVMSWALFKAGRYDEALDASEKALALGTPEPMFYYHAGMIAKVKGMKVEAKQQLEKALALNPHFDLKQAKAAEAALREVSR